MDVELLRARFPRSLALGSLFELFIVTAVSSLLLIRGLLALSGFPQVGGGGLHIAHMLWGGLLMLISLLLVLGFIGRTTLFLAAFVSGAGFGTFIDELGKFITSDNNYFFRPAIAVVYVVFVALFLVLRALESPSRFSDGEMLANAFEVTREAVVTRHLPAHAHEVIGYLRSRPGSDPLLLAMLQALEQAEPASPSLPAPLLRMRRMALRLLGTLVAAIGRGLTLTALVVAYAIVTTASLAVTLSLWSGNPQRFPLRGGLALDGVLLSHALSFLFLGLALVRMPSSRLDALRWFERAVIVDLLVGQVFSFYWLQFGALVGLAIDLALLVVLRASIRAERRSRLSSTR